MTHPLPGACLLAAAVVLAWPRRRPVRQRIGTAHPWWSTDDPTRVGLLVRLLARHAPAPAAILLGALGAASGGPVAALVLGAYGAAAGLALRHHLHRRDAVRVRERSLDTVESLAAELRAGLPVFPAPPGGADSSTVDDLEGRARAVIALAEETGAPVADLLDRIATDARTVARAAAVAHAQAAGVRVTAWLLTGLPLAGLVLGHGIGADPLRILLRTPVGAGCAIAALILQLAGLVWLSRLGRPAVTG